jgi:hypothetical protein
VLGEHRLQMRHRALRLFEHVDVEVDQARMKGSGLVALRRIPEQALLEPCGVSRFAGGDQSIVEIEQAPPSAGSSHDLGETSIAGRCPQAFQQLRRARSLEQRFLSAAEIGVQLGHARHLRRRHLLQPGECLG